MDINGLIIAANAIYSRQIFAQDLGRQDICMFAELARDMILGRIALTHVTLPVDWELWRERVRGQIRVEADFPIGTRLGSFANSPVVLIADLIEGRQTRVPTDQLGLLQWLRARTWITAQYDAEVEAAIGVSLPEAAKLLAQLFVDQPVLFFMMLCDESSLTTAFADQPIYPARPLKSGMKQRLFHNDRPLLDVMDMIGEWRRVIALADDCYENREFIHTRFRDQFVGRNTIHFAQIHKAQAALFDAHFLSVPSLRVRMDDHIPSCRVGLKEFDRVVTPDALTRRTQKEPLYHFYGLDHVEIAMVGLLEIIAYARGIPQIDSANARLFNVKHARLWFGENRLKSLISGIFKHWWPNDTPALGERAIKAFQLRHVYARKAGVKGNGYRFDPRMWRKPTNDALLFKRLATCSANSTLPVASFPNMVAWVRDCLCASFSTPISAHEVEHAAYVVAHLMTAATPLTRDPTFRQFQHHSMWASGYRAKRHKPKNGPKTDQPSHPPASTYMPFAGRWWGCVIPPLKPSLTMPPMLPLKGYHYALSRRESCSVNGFFA